jgi:hypothetical protein
MNSLGQSIAFAALVAGSAWLEINGKPASGLWIVVVIWALLADWHPKQKDEQSPRNRTPKLK